MHRTALFISFLLSASLLAHGPVDDLITAKSKEILENPSAKLYLERALLNEQHEDWPECKKDLLQAQNLNRELTDFDYFYGRIELAQAHDEVAIKYFQKSLKKSPQNIDAIFSIGRAYFSLKDYQSASEYFDQAIKQMKDVQPHHILEQFQAHQLSNETPLPKLVEILESGLKKFGQALTLQIELYKTLYDAKEYQLALEACDDVLNNVTRKERWYIEKVKCYIGLNDKEKAKNELKKAFDIFVQMPKRIKARKLVKSLIDEATKLKDELD
ncbi:MAG: hypothetical protein NE334_06665 [Lentisphaeraceae bacterium]|nr:hypothetical protein [Lentisphaeraceae bacterium]